MAPLSPGLIELRIGHVRQLFNTLDTSPFHERDLDHDAEEFIVGWAREHEDGAQLRIKVTLRQKFDPSVTGLIQESIRHYFNYRAKVTRSDLLELFREGRTALAIGVVFLALTLALRSLVPSETWAFNTWIREGLTICGWVGLWKPIDILFYRWWPLHRLRGLQKRLASCPVEVIFES
ncbi:MAG: hypothetical protein WCO73_01200 [Verrucomicrobiota bacterium]